MVEDQGEIPPDEESEGARAIQTMLALRVLYVYRGKLEAKHVDLRKEHGDLLLEATEKFQDKVRDAIPSRANDCKDRVVEIQDLLGEREDVKRAMAVALEAVKAEISENQAAFDETLYRQGNPTQTNFDFDHGGERFDPHAGLNLGVKHLDRVREAIEDYDADVDGEVAGLEDLRARVEAIGEAGLPLPDIGGDNDD